MAKPRKGVVPPQLRAFLFKKGGGRAGRRTSGAAKPSVTHMARRGSRKGKRRSGGAALPIIPTALALLPEAYVGMKALQEHRDGADAGALAEGVIKRLKAMYGIGPEQDSGEASLKTNAAAKAGAALLHVIMRKAGMRMRLSKRYTLF